MTNLSDHATSVRTCTPPHLPRAPETETAGRGIAPPGGPAPGSRAARLSNGEIVLAD